MEGYKGVSNRNVGYMVVEAGDVSYVVVCLSKVNESIGKDGLIVNDMS